MILGGCLTVKKFDNGVKKIDKESDGTGVL